MWLQHMATGTKPFSSCGIGAGDFLGTGWGAFVTANCEAAKLGNHMGLIIGL